MVPNIIITLYSSQEQSGVLTFACLARKVKGSATPIIHGCDISARIENRSDTFCRGVSGRIHQPGYAGWGNWVVDHLSRKFTVEEGW